MKHGIIVLVGLTILLAWPRDLGAEARRSSWEKSVVSIEVSRKQYDYLQPWSRRLETVFKSGLVVGPQQILTTADHLHDTTLIRIQKDGRGTWYQGRLTWIDYHANLALVSSSETNLWQGLRAVTFVEPAPTRGTVQVVRWRNGRLEESKGEVNRLIVKHGKLTQMEHLHLQVNSEMTGGGWAELVASGNRVAGLGCSQEGNDLTVLPSSFIQPILKAHNAGRFPGLGYFDFIWQKAENPATLAYLKLPGPPRGVIVIDPGQKLGHISPIQAKDILLQIDGFDLDNEGDYRDPDYGKLSLENLAASRKWSGDRVRIKLWRDGMLKEVDYQLPKAAYDTLIPQAVFDQEPEYLIAGGLVIQPLIEPYLLSWGTDWRRRGRFRLVYYTQEKATPERPARVVLSTVLPDRFNIGYQDYRFMVIDRVNGRVVNRLSEVATALESPQGNFHIIDFAPGEPVQKTVLAAAEMPDATARILQVFAIQRDRCIAADDKE
jgi:hypothetical protein